ncbi:hypothetical protein [Hyalangium versicolor]|uniref:hypothetical protein n=1 Tax=Hyalangium versicolor TaxID=2861190 RepID=UPI001CC91045|nr:hypothetical protein [Hyalangium versicolor]
MIDRIATLRSFIATLLVALWAVQPVVAVVHSREHAHRFCPEHQTFEETARGSGQWQSRSSSSTPLLSALRRETGVDSVRPTHEACPLQTADTRGDAQSSEAWVAISACLGTSVLATAPPRSITSVPILATAPKLSPPARS